ncbi:uncharacterized protein LOC122620085 isoform X2 [Drosophila teissieri]|uniref:uncharacterized protein LOC122620085 isoform X2 n=1 Tax=Drosophila teissieri TaxID=7243 RepID=UPI001CBA2A1E|nr:uncharacterized protein LOC122620085 isoform X2 [Drosophila teissieri]
MNCKLRRLDLLRNGQKSDCELHVWHPDKAKEGKRCPCIFRCHQVMLISASAEFERLIRDPEFQKNKRVLSVEDASSTAYEALLLYIYTYEKILPVATQVLKDNSFLKLSVKELKALMIILKQDGILSDHELLTSLKNYQEVNNLRYENMEHFQQFVEVTQLFGHVLFEVDGTMVLREADKPSPEE